MAKTDWNKNNLTKLKVYGDKGHFVELADRLNCTVNAVKIKYGREFGIKTINLNPVKNVVIHACEVTKLNPFVIEQVAFTGTKATPEIVIMLAHQMLNIKADKIDSILIPYGIANSKAASGNIFQQAKNHIAKISKDELVYTIKSTFSGDADKKYLSARIWRIK
jgi:hypothetical protein